MKILYVCNVSNVRGAGGMEYHLMDIAEWLGEKGAELRFAVREGTFLQKNLLPGRYRTYPLSWNGWRKLLSFFQYLSALKDYSPEIVSINRERDILRIYLLTKLAGAVLGRRPKVVAVFHNPDSKRFFVLGRLDGVIFTSEYTKRGYIPKNPGAEEKSVVIHHGIRLPRFDASKFDPHRERRFFRGNAFPIVGMVGEIRKNQEELIEVAACLRKRVPHFTMAVVGGGSDPELRAMKERIGSLGLAGHFVFTGRVDRGAIPDVFYDFDVSVSTYRGEGFGLVHIESLAAGTPVVVYRAGGVVEIVEKGGGILVDGGPEKMADSIGRLILDHEFRVALGREGRRAAETEFSMDVMGERHLRFYQGLLGAGT